ncbi:Dihydrofolate reductase [Catalinimonas alkaloidigena]|uniref:Dihydrofolate reductase n=1 Tax=Catalinimonas alkaloidigena TaxID=1075417 RepID=A0A1G9H0X7_9BACT|nr:dihydrofolate reductase family protein [Catalinimonas alkaloidigena]SDL06590.1 Dihydrofolate reductase [Catalinimonas alkaloidigena]
MRKLSLHSMITLNGYYEGPHGEIHWHHAHEEHQAFALDQLATTDLLVFGRRTYETMVGYWPTETARHASPALAERMHATPKLVFSRTLASPAWAHTELTQRDAADELRDRKQQSGRDITILGSAHLSRSLLEAGLIDELQLVVNPVVLGAGRTLLAGLPTSLRLQLLRVRPFASGNVLLTYAPAASF